MFFRKLPDGFSPTCTQTTIREKTAAITVRAAAKHLHGVYADVHPRLQR